MNEPQKRSEGVHPMDEHLEKKLESTKLRMKVETARIQRALGQILEATELEKTPTDLAKAMIRYGHATAELGDLLIDWDYTLDAMELRKKERN